MVRTRNLKFQLILISTCLVSVALLSSTCGKADAAYDCSLCHKMPPVDTPFRDWQTGGFKGNHQTHQPADAATSDCSTCHPVAGYTSGHMNRRIEFQANIKNSPATGVYKVNGQIVTFKNQTTVPEPGRCSNVNCHFETETPQWGTESFTYNPPLANDCNKCHGTPPSGIGQNPAGGAAGSHARHDVYYPGVEQCRKCHPNHLADSNRFSHATSAGNRGLIVQPRDHDGIPGGSYSGNLNDYLPSRNNAFGSCNNTYCHSEGKSFTAPYVQQAPITWGTAVSCYSCHNSAPNYATGKANSHSRHNFVCDKCHADVFAAGAISNNSLHVNKAYDVQSGAGATFTLSVRGTPTTPTQCSDISCHAGGTATWGTRLSCGSCHEDMSSSTGTGSHPKHGNTYNLDCSICHGTQYNEAEVTSPDHGNETVNLTFTGVAESTVYSKGSSFPTGTPYGTCNNSYCHSSGKSFIAPYAQQAPITWGATINCNSCHNGTPNYTSGKANSHASHDYTCEKCHMNVYNNGQIINTALHANKAYNLQSGGGEFFTITVQGTPTTPTQCGNISCHGNSSATWGSNAGCLACHENSIGNRAGIGSQFRGNSHHVQGVTANGTHCYSCHWEAKIDGTINRTYHQRTTNAPVDLVIYGAGTRPTAYTVGTTVVQYTANGTRTELAKINTHCLACHSTANDTTTPFNDGKTPKAYAWDGTSIKARYGDTATTAWGKYAGGNVTPKNKVTKAFSAHGNAIANQGGWDLNETWPNKRTGTANILCFDCHNSHGSTVNGTTTSYASATLNGGILKDTSAGKGGYGMTYRPAAGGLPANRNTYGSGAGLCFDCHLSASTGVTPWGYNATFGATQAILGYMDTPYFGLGSFGTQQRFPYKATANMGGHLGASSTLLVSATRPINGLCTPCHDPHGISTTMGTNRQYAVPLLKGTWVTSPYKEDAATRDNRAYLYMASPGDEDAPRPAAGTFAAYTSAIKSYKIDQNTFTTGAITQTDAQFGGLCLSCHPKTSLTNGTTHTWKSKDRVHESVKGWKTANTTIKHSYSCSKCHAPHNARLPRLMVSNCLDYKHRGRVTNNLSPVTSGSYRGEDGSGSGAIPGSYAGGEGGPRGTAGNGKWSGWGSNPPSSNLFTCHENNDSTQRWNTKTPWTK